MTAKKKRNYNKSKTENNHGKNEEAIGEEPGQPSFLVNKSIPRDKEKFSFNKGLNVPHTTLI